MDNSEFDEIELNNIGSTPCDPESLVQRPRGSSWLFRYPSFPDSSSFKAPSIKSVVSYWSVNLFVRWRSRSRRPVAINVPTHGLIKTAHDKLIAAVLGGPISAKSEVIQSVSSWYTSYLESKIRESWGSLFCPVLENTDSCTDILDGQDISAAFHFLIAILPVLRTPAFALTDIVDEGYNQGLLRYTDEERSHANQLVFSAVGWIGTFYVPRIQPDPNKLQIENPYEEESTAFAARLQRKPRTFTSFDQTLELNDQPFHTLLRQFGAAVPVNSRYMDETDSASPKRNEERIEPSLLFFHTLRKVAFINIEWVDSLSLHLEFDRLKKVLRVFRMPSLCLFMCCSKEISLFSQLISDSVGRDDLLTANEVEDAIELYREVLLTYRMIFSQDEKSFHEFNVASQTDTPIPEECLDPLLRTLCGQSWKSKEASEVYKFIGVEFPSNHYISTEFRFLGKNLLEIQKYVKGVEPITSRVLYNDRRDLFKWWTLWAVIIIGGVTVITTVILGILQIVIGILQVYYTRQQLLSQSRGGSPTPQN